MESDPAPDREAVFRSPDPRLAREPALVLAAVGIAAEFVRVEDSVWLVVASEDAPRARRELRAYVEENRWARAELAPFEPVSSGLAVGLAWVLSLVLARAAVLFRLGEVDWSGLGRADAAAMVEGGEWWRAVTALFLHADALHLASNLVFGALFAVFLAHATGSGLAAALLLASGALGNVANAFARGPEHLSVGASTAVFGAVGALVAIEFARRRRSDTDFVRRTAPMLIGALLFGWFGTGGERTDVTAHLFGLAAGAASGALATRTLRPREAGVQRVSWALAGLVVAAAWAAALT